MTRANWKVLVLILGYPLWSASTCAPRQDDTLEPNNTRLTATLLVANQPLEARVKQGNPDVFRFFVPAQVTANVVIQHIGLEQCPAFQLIDPDGYSWYSDETIGHCSQEAGGNNTPLNPVLQVTHTPGVYQFTFTPDNGGFHYLYITERTLADNLLELSWDYRIELKLTQHQ